jgi:hypothetical protein
MANIRSRIGLLVEAQGARRAAGELDSVARSTRNIGSESRTAGRRMGLAQTSARRLHDQIRGLGTAAKYGALAIAALGVAVAKGAVSEYREAWRAGRQTNAVIKSTGGVAKVSAKQVSDLSNALSVKSGIDDEVIQGAENILLTFTKVRNETGKGNDVFNRATGAITDLSVAMGVPMSRAAVMVGKALQDPVTGMTAMRRVGVNFTKDQSKMVAGWLKHGQTLRAQKFILRELNREFAGSAKAQADPLARMTVAWKNFEETLGGIIVPPLNKMLDKVLPSVQKFVTDVQDIWSRKDLSTSLKLGLTKQAAIVYLKPFLDQARRSLKHAHLGERLGQFIEQAAPIIADHAAAAAPRAASAFIHAFMNMGPWGKFLTVAFLASKLGAFSWAGKKAGAYFLGTLGAQMAGANGLGAVIGAPARNAGRSAGALAGRVFRGAFIAAVAFGLYEALSHVIDNAINRAAPGYKNAHKQGQGGTFGGGSHDTNPILNFFGSLPGFASGGTTPGGPIMVGEDGPEIITQPAGNEVHPLNRELAIHVHAHVGTREVAHDIRRLSLRDLLASGTA